MMTQSWNSLHEMVTNTNAKTELDFSFNTVSTCVDNNSSQKESFGQSHFECKESANCMNVSTSTKDENRTTPTVTTVKNKDTANTAEMKIEQQQQEQSKLTEEENSSQQCMATVSSLLQVNEKCVDNASVGNPDGSSSMMDKHADVDISSPMLESTGSPRRSRRLSPSGNKRKQPSSPSKAKCFNRVIVKVDDKVMEKINFDKIVSPPKLPTRRSRRLSLEPPESSSTSITKKKSKSKKKKRKKKNVIYHDPDKVAPVLPKVPLDRSILQRPAYSSIHPHQKPQKRAKHSRNVIFNRPKAAFYVKMSLAVEYEVMDQDTVDSFFSIAPNQMSIGEESDSLEGKICDTQESSDDADTFMDTSEMEMTDSMEKEPNDPSEQEPKHEASNIKEKSKDPSDQPISVLVNESSPEKENIPKRQIDAYSWSPNSQRRQISFSNASNSHPILSNRSSNVEDGRPKESLPRMTKQYSPEKEVQHRSFLNNNHRIASCIH